jgi:asparagine synthase (glutamine-hydrolysing)
MSANFKAKRFLRGLDFSGDVRHQAWIGSFTPREQKNLFLPGLGLDLGQSKIYAPTKRAFDNTAKLAPLDKAIYIYVKTYMTDDILTKVDRASMANSLEVRAPFLDADFARFACSIPVSQKLKNFNTKWILKDALKGKLPEETLKKSKKGFAVPVAKWLKEDLRPMLDEAFDRKKIEREGIFDYNYVNKLKDEFAANENDTRKEIWSLFMFEMWYDKWM